jgi:hypothetical protein
VAVHPCTPFTTPIRVQKADRTPRGASGEILEVGACYGVGATAAVGWRLNGGFEIKRELPE